MSAIKTFGTVDRRSLDRQRSLDHLGHRRQRSHDRAVPATRWHAGLDPETARSCRTPAISEGRQGGRDVEIRRRRGSAVEQFVEERFAARM